MPRNIGKTFGGAVAVLCLVSRLAIAQSQGQSQGQAQGQSQRMTCTKVDANGNCVQNHFEPSERAHRQKDACGLWERPST